MPPSAAPVAPRRQATRLVVPDVLRGVAILAMLIAHGASPLLPDSPAWLEVVFGQINDLASPLFVFVMGLSAQLMFDRAPRSPGAVVLQQVARGVILIALGYWLATWGSWVDIILAYLGIVAIIAAPLLFLPTWWIASAAAFLLFALEPLTALLRDVFLPLLIGGSEVWSWPAVWFAYGGNYRITMLLPIFLIGVLVARFAIPDRPVVLAVLGGGGILLIVAWLTAWAVADGRPEVGTYGDMAHDLGLVALAYVTVAVLATAPGVRARRVIDTIFVPLRACGSLALSLYVVQIALIAWWVQLGYGYQGNEPLLWLILVPGLMVAGVLWWRFVGLGPLEWLIGVVTARHTWRRRAAESPPPVVP